MIAENPMSYEDAIDLIGVLRGNIAAMRLDVDRYRMEAHAQTGARERSLRDHYNLIVATLNKQVGHVGRSIARITGIAKDYDAQISDLKAQIAQLMENADGKGK